MNKYDIIRRPIITEKSTQVRERTNTFLFEVDRRANKIEIRKAVESLFSVKVLDVRTMNVHGKWQRVGRNVGRHSDWKKAIVTLAENQTIPLLESN